MTTATQSEFAAHLGKDKSYVTRLKQAGRLVMTADGKVDVEASRQMLAQTADPGKSHVTERHAVARGEAPREPAEQVEGAGRIYQQSRAINEKYKALSAKTEYERMIGKLIDKDDVQAALDDVVSFARQGIENLPHRVAAQLVGKDFDQIMATLKQEVVTMMGEMHREAGKQVVELTKVDG
jgi:hypothetical protein